MRRLLGDEEAAERGHLDRLLDRRRIELDDRPARPPAGVVDDEVEAAAGRVDRREQPRDILDLGGVARDRGGAGLAHQPGELARVARGEEHLHARPRVHLRANAALNPDPAPTITARSPAAMTDPFLLPPDANRRPSPALV